MNEKAEFLFFKNPVKIFLGIRKLQNPYPLKVARDTGITNSHLNSLIGQMVDMELIEKEPSGRRCYLRLTPKGKKFADKIEEIMRIIK